MNNAKCSICGLEYEVCNSCLEQKKIKPWRTVTDTIDHYKIFLAIHGYTISKDKERAKQDLNKCNLSDLETFNPEIKTVIKKILTESKKKSSQKNTKIISESIPETEKIKESSLIE